MYSHIRTLLCTFVALFFIHSLAPLSTAAAHFQLHSRDNVIAKRSPSTTTASEPPSPISLRQHHERRAILDVCASVKLDLTSLDLGLLDLGTDLDLCLCLSALPLALKTDLKLKVLADVLGIPLVTDLLTKLILGTPGKQECPCPEHGHLNAVCSSTDPCGFTCDPPYVRDGDHCVCKSPYTECNGKCGSFPHGCGSAVPYAGLSRRSSRRTRNTLPLV